VTVGFWSGMNTWTPQGGFAVVDDPQGPGATTINGVNDHGDLVGLYTDAKGNTDGLVATSATGSVEHLQLQAMPRGTASFVWSPVQYMLMDFVANSRGQIVNQVRMVAGVTMPVPATGWYLNLHQGNSNNILANGQPTVNFRPLLCANI
jgi:hypothetical protein